MREKQPCPHLSIKQQDAAADETGVAKEGWYCVHCNSEFMPAEYIGAMEEQNDAVIDMATAMFSAVLWDLHLKARGENPDIEARAPEDIYADAAKAVCEAKGHDRAENGVCQRCGDNPFLGGP